MLRKIFNSKWVKRILIFHGILLLLLVGLFFYMRHVTINNYEQAISNGTYDVIIVPGVPFEGKEWHNIMKARVHWSKHLFENGHTKNIIYSGGAVYTPYVEGIVMKKFGVALDLPRHKLFVETTAEHSTENLYYSYQMAKKKRFKKIALATDPVQSFFLMRFALNHNMTIDYLPIQFDILEKLDLIDPNIDPSSAFVHNFVALPERQGFIKRFQGTLGQHIKRPSD